MDTWVYLVRYNTPDGFDHIQIAAGDNALEVLKTKLEDEGCFNITAKIKPIFFDESEVTNYA